MFFRTRLLLLLPALLLVLAPARASSAAAESAAEASPEMEAQRLYDRANDFVTSINEGDYSYSYIQFHWKRAQSNIDRVLRVYPNTPTARALKAGQLKVGSYELPYFKERVLARLEEKRIAAYDSVNCAIFLAGAKGETWDDSRRDAIMRIIEVLSRQKRWTEALRFNAVQDRDRPLKWATIFRVAVRFEQQDIIKDMLAKTPKHELTEIHAILGEAMALRGLPRQEIATLLDSDPDDTVKLAVLSGMIQREIKIQRTAALRLPMNNIVLAGDVLKRPEVRDDVNAVTKIFFPAGNAAAAELLANYRAALGERPALDATLPTHLAYLEYLAAFEKFDELASYLRRASNQTRPAFELKAIELYAQAGRTADSQRLFQAYIAAAPAQSDAATLAQFRGQMNSADVPLSVQEKTFANLPFKDPSQLAQAIMEWSLTTNRSIRGASPYDSVVQKFAPGFVNLAAPKSAAVRDAASTEKPY